MKAKIITFLILSSMGVFAFVRYKQNKTNTAYQAEAFASMPDDAGSDGDTGGQASWLF